MWAVIVDQSNRIVSLGFNGFPAGADDSPEVYEDRETKYLRVVHAETNAILFSGGRLSGCTLYIVPMPPCANCAALIAQAGIKKVITIPPTVDQSSRWDKAFAQTHKLFTECGVELIYV